MLFKFEVFNFFTQALDVNRSFIFRTLDEVPKGRASKIFGRREMILRKLVIKQYFLEA